LWRSPCLAFAVQIQRAEALERGFRQTQAERSGRSQVGERDAFATASGSSQRACAPSRCTQGSRSRLQLETHGPHSARCRRFPASPRCSRAPATCWPCWRRTSVTGWVPSSSGCSAVSWRQLQAKAKRGNGGKLAAAPGGATPSRLSRPGGQGWPRGRRLLEPGGPLRRASSGSSTRPRRRYGFAAPIFIGLSAGLR
jgi:hypothetical protein